MLFTAAVSQQSQFNWPTVNMKLLKNELEHNTKNEGLK
ncbi:hypothetical protein T12_10362 [Trichinella patagoniensis]|uniref:Uncharacterized protein n=1 Tax=Trichinella patagoniensis TaxID=990121 RepID=A0A0V0YYW8_9BILA|nr:hypothetical protein T12_10362 [Trichinella patagoniensis]